MPRRIVTITLGTAGHLVVDGDRSVLVDCPSVDTGARIADLGLPRPEAILHTQVQEEHCREWGDLADVHVHVPAPSREAALRSETYFAEAKTIWPPDRPWDDLGREPHGIAGCVTERPPEKPLAVAGVYADGETVEAAGVRFRAVALPGSGKRAFGLLLEEENILFAGDLLEAGGYPVNLYDLERSYGSQTGWTEYRESLAKIRDTAPARILPSTGPAVTDPTGDIDRLTARLDWSASVERRRVGEPRGQINYEPVREFGRYREVLPGVYQNNNAGNIVLFVNDDGRGLLVDPDPCVWFSWEENCRLVNEDFDLLEKEAGLRALDMMLLTHYHGDHVQYADLLRERYPGCELVATPDVAAVVEHPERFPYPCTVDWYGFPFTSIAVDRRVPYGTPVDWNGATVTPLHTPGHCFAHAGWALDVAGHRCVCTGDTLQRGGGPVGPSMPIIWNDGAAPDRSLARAMENIAAAEPTLVLGGHSHGFFDPDGELVADLLAVARDADRALATLAPDGDIRARMTPPGYDAVRPPLATTLPEA